MNYSRFIVLFIIMSFSLNGIMVYSFDNTVRAGTLVVDKDGGGDHTTILSAIENCSDTDTVYINSGTYWEDNIPVSKNITIQGQNKNNTIIKTNLTNAVILNINASTITIHELNFSGPNSNTQPAVLFGEEALDIEVYDCDFLFKKGIRMDNNYNSMNIIHHCDFYSSGGVNSIGISYNHDYAKLGGSITVHNCSFFDYETGVGVLDSIQETKMDSVVVENCSFDLTSESGWCLDVYHSFNVLIQDNVLNDVLNSKLNGLIGAFKSWNVTIHNNTALDGSETTIRIYQCNGVNITDNTIDNASSDGIFVSYFGNWQSRFVNVSGNIVNGSENALRLSAPLWNVTVTDNYFINATDYCLWIEKTGAKSFDNITIYDNYFSGNDVYVEPDVENVSFNISKTGGLNILGGMYLGGNYWWNYSGSDANGDGIGDTNYSLNGSSLFDELPLIVGGGLGPPTDITGVIEGGTNLNISWTKNGSADTTFVRSKTGGYPNSVTDGTLEYNNSGSYYVDTWVVDTYYTLWSYNSTINGYSNPAYLIMGSITVNVYNESNISQSIDEYSVTVFNEEGNLISFYNECSNPYVIDLNDLGSDGLYYFQMEHENYSSRTYYSDINLTTNYILNAYLPPLSANLYYIKVIDELEEPISNANIVITRSINGNVYEMSSGVTNDYGLYPVFLIPEKTYFINISATGYISIVNGGLVPDPVYYGYNYPIVYQLILQSVNETIYYDFSSYIVFTGEMFDNDSILITYKDKLLLTDDTQIRVFETYNGTDTLLNIHNSTDTDSFSYYIESINTTRLHYADLYFNHSLNFSVDQPVRIFIHPINFSSRTNATNLEEALTNVFGTNPLGWGNSIAVAIALILLASFGPVDVGIAIISAGFGLAVPMIAFAFNNPLLFVILPVIILIGIVYIIAKNPEVNI